MSDKLVQLQARISDKLEDICAMFTQRPKITIVIRTPWIEGEGDVVLTDDDTGEAIDAIRRLERSKTANVLLPTVQP